MFGQKYKTSILKGISKRNILTHARKPRIPFKAVEVFPLDCLEGSASPALVSIFCILQLGTNVNEDT